MTIANCRYYHGYPPSDVTMLRRMRRACCRAVASSSTSILSSTAFTAAVVFDTTPAASALREVVAGTELDAAPHPGIGAAIWMHATSLARTSPLAGG
jgi:hypothetical protein